MSAPAGHVGVIYLLHFSRPYRHARHYTGWTESSGSLRARLARHERGDGARLLEIVHAAGITWQLARTWTGPRARERQINWQYPAASYVTLAAAPTGNGWELFAVVAFIYAACLLVSDWRHSRRSDPGRGQ